MVLLVLVLGVCLLACMWCLLLLLLLRLVVCDCCLVWIVCLRVCGMGFGWVSRFRGGFLWCYACSLQVYGLVLDVLVSWVWVCLLLVCAGVWLVFDFLLVAIIWVSGLWCVSWFDLVQGFGAAGFSVAFGLGLCGFGFGWIVRDLVVISV